MRRSGARAASGRNHEPPESYEMMTRSSRHVGSRVTAHNSGSLNDAEGQMRT
jgi:hypothetical protein